MYDSRRFAKETTSGNAPYRVPTADMHEYYLATRARMVRFTVEMDGYLDLEEFQGSIGSGSARVATASDVTFYRVIHGSNPASLIREIGFCA